MRFLLLLYAVLCFSLAACGKDKGDSLRSKITDTEWQTESGNRINFYVGGTGSYGGGTSFKWETKDGVVVTEKSGDLYISYVYSKENGVEKLVQQSADGDGRIYIKVR